MDTGSCRCRTRTPGSARRGRDSAPTRQDPHPTAAAAAVVVDAAVAMHSLQVRPSAAEKKVDSDKFLHKRVVVAAVVIVVAAAAVVVAKHPLQAHPMLQEKASDSKEFFVLRAKRTQNVGQQKPSSTQDNSSPLLTAFPY